MRGDLPRVIRFMILLFLVPLAFFIYGVGSFFEWLVERVYACT